MGPFWLFSVDRAIGYVYMHLLQLVHNLLVSLHFNTAVGVGVLCLYKQILLALDIGR